MFQIMNIFRAKIKPGNNIILSGGYDMNPKWLNGENQKYAVALRFMPGQNKGEALLVQFKEPFQVDGYLGKYAVLELRYEGAQWCNGETCHIEICDFEPENRRWKERKQGKWVESHATIRLKK